MGARALQDGGTTGGRWDRWAPLGLAVAVRARYGTATATGMLKANRAAEVQGRGAGRRQGAGCAV